MKHRTEFMCLALAVGLGFVAALLWLLGSGMVARAAPTFGLQVCHSGCAFSSVQEAVDAATPGELIQVATGVYTGVHARAGITQVAYISKTVMVRGGYSADFSEWDPALYPTTLDAQGQGRVIYINGSEISPSVEGLRIVGGDAAGLHGDPWGGDAGGGLFASYSAVTLTGNTFVSNTAWTGGGLYLAYSPARLDANIVIFNVAKTDGGGLVLNGSQAILVNTVIADNRGGNRGSGALIYSASPRLLHTTLARNHGGDGAGVCVDDSGIVYSNVAMTNTIVFSHSVGVRVIANSAAALDATLWQANVVSMTGNVTHADDLEGDSAFATDGYHLTAGSAAIDHGVDAGVVVDVDGDSRPIGLLPDIGADEALCLWRVYLPLVARQ